MPAVGIGVRVTDNRLDDVARELDWVASAWAYNMASYQVSHTRQEAPLGHEFYTDEAGHEHPGWLRDSVDQVGLPNGTDQWVMVHADYGVYVNGGTRYQAPNPFWERASLRTEREAGELLDWAVRQMWARVRL